MEHETGVLCGGIDFDEVLFFVFLCVGIQFLFEFDFAGCTHDVSGVAGLATNNMEVGGLLRPSKVDLSIAFLWAGVFYPLLLVNWS